MTALGYLAAVKRRWPAVVLSVLIAASAALWVGQRPADKSTTTIESFSATSIILGAPNRGELGDLDTLSSLANVGRVPVLVAERLARLDEPLVYDPVILGGQVQAQPDDQTGLLSLTALAATEDEAVVIANTFADELVRFVNKISARDLEKGLKALRKEQAKLEAEVEDLRAQVLAAAIEDRGPLETRLAKRNSQLLIVDSTIDQLRTVAAASGPTIIQEATPAELSSTIGDPGGDRSAIPLRLLIVAMFFGACAGIAGVIVLDHFKGRLYTKDAAEEHLKTPVLTELPLLPKPQRGHSVIPVVEAPTSLFADAIRLLAAHIDVLRPSRVIHLPEAEVEVPAMATAVGSSGGARTATRPELVIRSRGQVVGTVKTSESAPARPCGRRNGPHQMRGTAVLVISARPGEGKTTLVTNLAAGFAELGKKTLVLSCDFYRPRLHEALGVDNDRGVADVAMAAPGEVRLADCIVKTRLDDELTIGVVPIGRIPDQRGELLGPDRMKRVVDEARQIADVVLIDTAPILATSDASALLPNVDSVVLVARAGKTTVTEAEHTIEILERLGTPPCGVVLNGVKEMTMWSRRPGPRRFVPGFLSHRR